MEANILESLKHANEVCATLNQNPTAWTDAARSFIAAFDEFDQGLRGILDAEGAKPYCGSAVLMELWKQDRTFPKWGAASRRIIEGILKEETIEGMSRCGPYWWRGVCCDTENVGEGCCFTWAMSWFFCMGPLM